MGSHKVATAVMSSPAAAGMIRTGDGADRTSG
jgi:hypothetical protein